MKSYLERRISSLEARRTPIDRKDIQILHRCTDAELDRLGEIAKRTEDGRKELIAEEVAFLEGLEVKYAY